MSIRNAMLTFAALFSIAGAVLAPTSASALGGHGFHGEFGHGPVVSSHLHITQGPIIYKNGQYHRVRGWGHDRFWPREYGFRHWPRYEFGRLHRPVGIGGVSGAASTAMMTSAGAPATGPANCLTKQYAPDGTAVFKDLCTGEEGIGQPAGPMAQGPQGR